MNQAVNVSLKISKPRLNIRRPEPEFFKVLKCNSAESASAGFQFNCYGIFNHKTLN
jgi:hypothetical protein